MRLSATSESTVASTSPTATMGDLVASPAASGDDSNEDVDDVRTDGGIDSTEGDDGGISRN